MSICLGIFKTILNVIECLNHNGIFNEDNFHTLLTHCHFEKLTSILSNLEKAGQFTQANFALIATIADQSEHVCEISLLLEADILTPSNLAALAHHDNIEDLGVAFHGLNNPLMNPGAFHRILVNFQSGETSI